MQEACRVLEVENSAVLFPLGPGCAWMSTTMGSSKSSGPCLGRGIHLTVLSSAGSFWKRSTCVHVRVHMCVHVKCLELPCLLRNKTENRSKLRFIFWNRSQSDRAFGSATAFSVVRHWYTFPVRKWKGTGRLRIYGKTNCWKHYTP